MKFVARLIQNCVGPPVVVKNPVNLPTIFPGYGAAGKQLQRLHELSNYSDAGRIRELEAWITERENEERDFVGALNRIQNDLRLYRQTLDLLMNNPMWAPTSIKTGK